MFQCILRERVGFDDNVVYSLYSLVNLLMQYIQVVVYPLVCCSVTIENCCHLLGEISYSHVCHNCCSCFLIHRAFQTEFKCCVMPCNTSGSIRDIIVCGLLGMWWEGLVWSSDISIHVHSCLCGEGNCCKYTGILYTCNYNYHDYSLTPGYVHLWHTPFGQWHFCSLSYCRLCSGIFVAGGLVNWKEPTGFITCLA